MKILVGNFKSKIFGDVKKILKLQIAFKLKHPNAYFVRLKGYAEKGWDGKINYITDADYIKTGLLPMLIREIEEQFPEEVIDLVDDRADLEAKPVLPTMIGNLEPRPYQSKAIAAIIFNELKSPVLKQNLYFPFGVMNAATNAGKTMIMAGIYLAYQRKIPALVVINDADLYNQFKKEIPELVGDDAGFVRGKEKLWNNFTVVMAPTISRNIHSYKHKLSNYGIIMVDEADLADNKTYKKILTYCYNAKIRVGLSGTIYQGKLAKHKVTNRNIRQIFGNEVFKITKKEMVDKGFSTEIVIKMFKGNEKLGIRGDWKAEYDKCITYNEDRMAKCITRVKFNLKMGRVPALVVGKFHKHVELMYRVFKNEFGSKYRVEYVHSGIKSGVRAKIIDDFRSGKIDILISSLIVKRGKNFPLLRYILNASGSDSQSTISQIMGRGERTHSSKKKTYMEDFYDEGHYLSRHSKHRINYYKEEKFKVYLRF